MHIDPRIFTVVQLKFYLESHDVLVKQPASYRQPELFRLYSKHLADRPQLYPYQFNWPVMLKCVHDYVPMITFTQSLYINLTQT